MIEMKCSGCGYSKKQSNMQCNLDFYYCKKFEPPKYAGYKRPLSRFEVKAPEWCPLGKKGE